MASGFVLKARHLISQQTLDLVANTIKAMLLKSTYSHVNTRDFVGDASGFAASECDATGYTGGFGGASRQTLGSKAANRDDGNIRIEFDCADATFPTIGGATNNTLGGVGIIKEITDDASSPCVCFDDTNDVNTNGGDIIYAPNAEGYAQM
jgi:hypothetical protein